MTDEQLSALLRIKRFEQPPPQYFDRLLQDVHRRQRSELLRRPLWKIAAERVQTFFSEHSMGHLSYAGALASVLVVGVTAIGFMTSGGGSTGNGLTAQLPARGPVIAQVAPGAADKMVTLQAPATRHVLDHPALTVDPYESVGHEPRYVIDARPASYEPSSTINF